MKYAMIALMLVLSPLAMADRGTGGGGGDGYSQLEKFHAKNAYLKEQRKAYLEAKRKEKE